MNDQILRINLSELTTIRVKCGSCGVVVESSIESSGPLFSDPNCKHCGELLFLTDGSISQIERLSTAIRLLVKDKERSDIEFVIPDKSGSYLQNFLL